MENQDIIRVLTVDKNQYNATYLEMAQREIDRRGLVLRDRVDTVNVAWNNESGKDMTRAQAVAQAGGAWSPWALLTLVNCVGDAWVVQREFASWLIHFYERDAYRFSSFFNALPELSDTLMLFMSLEPWEVAESHELDGWKPIFETRSRAFLTKIVADLVRDDIQHTVKTPLFTGDKEGEYILTVPGYHVKAGEQIVGRAQEALGKLYDQAEKSALGDRREEELKLYDLLEQLVPENPAVHYNRAQALMEIGEEEGAIVALGEAIVLALPDLTREVTPSAGEDSLAQLAGNLNPLLSLLRVSHEKKDGRDISYPDYIDDCAQVLEGLLQRRPDNIPARHCLATISELKGDIASAKKYCAEILERDDTDAAARSNLAYHKAAEG